MLLYAEERLEMILSRARRDGRVEVAPWPSSWA